MVVKSPEITLRYFTFHNITLGTKTLKFELMYPK